jgi:transcriptional regulator with XRE-family HTH domain
MSTESDGFPPDPPAPALGLAGEPELDRDSWAQAVLTDLGVNIRAARMAAQMTQESLAGKLGCTQTAVSYWEAGKRDPGVPDLLRIAEALGEAAASLLPDTAPKAAPGAAEGCVAAGGYFAEISFFGRIEHTGYVTEVVLHGGHAAYHIDLPEKLWGGNPLAWREYAASAFFEKNPLSEESVRKAWEAERERAQRWKRQREEWERQRSQPALEAGDGCGDDLEPGADEADDYNEGGPF